MTRVSSLGVELENGNRRTHCYLIEGHVYVFTACKCHAPSVEDPLESSFRGSSAACKENGENHQLEKAVLTKAMFDEPVALNSILTHHFLSIFYTSRAYTQDRYNYRHESVPKK